MLLIIVAFVDVETQLRLCQQNLERGNSFAIVARANECIQSTIGEKAKNDESTVGVCCLAIVDRNLFFCMAAGSRRAATVGDLQTVSSERVSSPIAVPYAYAVNPQQCNLYNREGLPAAPFCSDPALLKYAPELPSD